MEEIVLFLHWTICSESQTWVGNKQTEISEKPYSTNDNQW